MLLWIFVLQAFVWTYVFNSLVHIPRSRIAKSYGSFMFSFLRTSKLLSTAAAPCYIPTSSVIRISISPYLHQHFLFSIFVFIHIWVSAKWHLIVVFICISLMTNNVEHLFMCLLAICLSSCKKCLLKCFAHFKFELFILLLLSSKNSLCILDAK